MSELDKPIDNVAQLNPKTAVIMMVQFPSPDDNAAGANFKLNRFSGSGRIVIDNLPQFRISA